jgi:hypothetical protein
MEAAFNVLMVILGAGFVGGIVFSFSRVRNGRSIMPDFRIPPSTDVAQPSELSHEVR